MKWSSFIICVSLLVWNFKFKTKQLTCTKKRQRPDKRCGHPTRLNLFLKCHVIYITKVIHTPWQLCLRYVGCFSPMCAIINSFRIKSWWGMHRFWNLKSLNSACDDLHIFWEVKMNYSQNLELQEGSCHLRSKLKCPGVVIHLSINKRMKSNHNALPKQRYGFPLAF